eukprot:1183583-Prorocentrum_minimum.AAC.2
MLGASTSVWVWARPPCTATIWGLGLITPTALCRRWLRGQSRRGQRCPAPPARPPPAGTPAWRPADHASWRAARSPPRGRRRPRRARAPSSQVSRRDWPTAPRSPTAPAGRLGPAAARAPHSWSLGRRSAAA